MICVKQNNVCCCYNGVKTIKQTTISSTMTTENIYQHLDRKIPIIQRFASQLTKDFELARFLYQETAHQAIKNKGELREDTLEEWLWASMKKTYAKLIGRGRS